MPGIKGKLQATFHTKEIQGRTKRALYQATREVAAWLENAIKETIGTPYPPASTPGQPPHRRTGNLHDNLRITADTTGAGALNVWTVPYGPFLEGGTSKMAPRPFVGPFLLGRRGPGMLKVSIEQEIARRARKHMRG